MANVSKNIRRLRTAEGLTQEQLAEKLHVTRQTISSWETGRTQPDLDMLSALSSALETETEALIYGRRRNVGLEAETDARRHTLGIVLSALGALFAAAGLIMIFVYFWQDLGEFFKTVLAFLPLAAGGAAGLLALFSKKENVFFREAAAVLWIAGLLSTNALANSVFALDAGFGRLLAFDILLTLPVMFLLQSAAACTANVAMLTVGVFTQELLEPWPKAWFAFFLCVCVLAAAAVVFFLLRGKLPEGLRRYAAVPALLALPADGIFAAVYLSEGQAGLAGMLIFAVLLCFFLADRTKKTNLPVRNLSLPLFAVLFFLLAIWGFLDGDMLDFRAVELCVFLPVCALAVCLTLWARGFRLKKEEWTAAAVLLALSAAALVLGDAGNAAALLPAFGFGVFAAVWGVRQASMFAANAGILEILALLVLIVWETAEDDLLVTGLTVLLAGAALLIANRLMAKKFAAKRTPAEGEEAAEDA